MQVCYNLPQSEHVIELVCVHVYNSIHAHMRTMDIMYMCVVYYYVYTLHGFTRK